MPFAIVSSNTLLEVNGKRVRGRLYPWGVVEGRRKGREGGEERGGGGCVYVLEVSERWPSAP